MRCAGTTAALANAELLEEALGNVLANAISYTVTGRIAVSATRRDSRVTIEIADTGPGMTADARAHAFDRFFRGDVQQRGGFGLGLPIAKAAVEAAGGEIELDSAEQRGTTARVTLRAATIRS
jgi:two-component system sensor histidine kinase CiaH